MYIKYKTMLASYGYICHLRQEILYFDGGSLPTPVLYIQRLRIPQPLPNSGCYLYLVHLKTP
jgi:hypothetical protein